jgi:glycine betaine/choline ABC-type transport system substrate-binding protein
MAFRVPLLILALFALAIVCSCNHIKRPVVIGAKDFAEQQIIAEIVAQTLRARDIPAEVDDAPSDSLDAIGALWMGDIDMYVEYTGTALALVGHPPVHDVGTSLAAAREQFVAFGLTWGPLLGFRNDYVVLARPGSIVAASSTQVSDLAAFEPPLQVGMTTDFRERPLDGFEAFSRRFGLRAEPALIVPSSPAGKDQLYAALLDGEIDLAIGFLTDPEIRDFDLVILSDDRGFFPAYASAPLTKAKFLERRPEVARALESLEDSLTTPQMRTMVGKVANLGAEPFTVAASFLDPTRISPPDGTAGRPLALSVGHLDAASGQTAQVVMALRKAFPRRQIDADRFSDPLSPLLAGNVRYAMVSGSEFFMLGKEGRRVQRGPVDALAPVGFDVMHLLTRPDDGADAWRPGTRLGVGEAGGVTARSAAFVQAGLDAAAVTLVPSELEGLEAFRSQADQLRAGAIDGLLVMAELGHPLIAGMLAHGLKLAPLDEWEKRGNRVAFPYLQPVTIPAAAYEGQNAPLASFGSQVVLAAARPDPTEAIGVVGPGSAAIGKTLPVGAGTVARIRAALDVEVRLDPSLPVAAAARQHPPERPASMTPSPFGSFITLTVIVALVFILRLYLIRSRDGAG